MEGIDGLDDGAYAFFGHQAERFDRLVDWMQPAYYISSYVGVTVLIVVIAVIFVLKGNARGALISLVGFASSIAAIELVRQLVPRARPQAAVAWLGPGAAPGSYPSPNVFLFMLCAILLGNAVWPSLSPRQRIVFSIVAGLVVAWVCLSQLMLSVYFLTDIFGGIAGATLIGWIACRLMPSPVAPVLAPAS